MKQHRDVIELLKEKRQEVERVLHDSFMLWVNAPNERTDRQGFLVLGSPLPHKSDSYTNFRYFIVGGRRADIQDIEETIAFADAESRVQYSIEGEDHHAIVSVREISEYLKLYARGGDEPLGLAVEVVFRDNGGEIFVVHYDGEYDEIEVDRKAWIRFLGGSHDETVRMRVLELANKHLRAEAVRPKRIAALLKALRTEYPALKDVQCWTLTGLV